MFSPDVRILVASQRVLVGQLPLSLLNTAVGHPMLVELKSGETYNGHLVSCDPWMNINLREVILTSPDGEKFYRLPECYIRGSSIKYLRVPDEILDLVKEEQRNRQQQRQGNRRDGGGAGGSRGGGGFRGGRGGGDRGRGRGGAQGGGQGPA